MTRCPLLYIGPSGAQRRTAAPRPRLPARARWWWRRDGAGVACKRLACADDDFYAWSWALFAYLLEQHFDRTAIYLQNLQANKGDHDLAWIEAFGEASLDELDRALRAWVESGEMRVVRFWLQPQATPAVERPLRDVEILTGLSLLPFAMGDLEGGIRLADQAIAVDRSYPLAWMMGNARGLKISEEEARAVLAANPDDWRAYQLLIFKLNDLGRSDEELAAAHPHVRARRPGEALLQGLRPRARARDAAPTEGEDRDLATARGRGGAHSAPHAHVYREAAAIAAPRQGPTVLR